MKVHDDIFQTLQLRLQVFKLLLTSYWFVKPVLRKVPAEPKWCFLVKIFFSFFHFLNYSLPIV